MFLRGAGVPQNAEVSAKYFEKAAINHQSPVAWFRLGKIYELGIGFPSNMPRATSCFEKSAKLGYAEAQLKMGMLSQDNPEKAKVFFHEAAQGGNDDACYLLGLSFVANKDWDNAAKQFLIAAHNRHAGALGAIGFQYLEGLGVEKDEKEALRRLQEAVDLADPFACFHLSQVYLKGTTLVEKDEQRGVQLLQKSADMGHPNALYQLGLLYWKGGCVIEKDLKEAVACFQKAAKGGNKKAQSFLDRAFKK
eukprot:TRINITY_DN5498_c0_g1_i2.p1 TRINITY_DN5498_c0_g1~~TRINITY_DN5498_c0_g1_i2.p1  ORF type:complete len:250 (-),score=48.98 TRINITY_DN5498_c0_g1_i2:7-756(-)